MKTETQQKIVKGVKELVGLVGDVAEEIQTDVKTKTGKALGMYTNEDVLNIIGFTRKELIKDRGVANAEILKRYRLKYK